MVYMSLSPDGTKLAALHLSGAMSLWQVPSLRHMRTWMQDEQVQYHLNVEGLLVIRFCGFHALLY